MSARLSILLMAGALTLMLTGCATPPPMQSEREKLRLDQPHEQVRVSRSGRFVIQVSSKRQPDVLRGGQGRFEWLSLTPAGSRDGRNERQVMILLGPLGQTLGSLERRISPSNSFALPGMGSAIKAFDAEGLVLSTAEQQRMLIALLGPDATRFDTADIDETLTLLMVSMERISQSLESPREFRFRIHQTDIMLRAALDPA